MRKNFLRIILFVAGGLLLGASAFFALKEYSAALPESGKIAEALEAVIPGRTDGTLEERGSYSMPVYSYKGVNYSGILSCEQMGVTLPVLAEWDKRLAKTIPAKFSGSTWEGTLIIGGGSNVLGFITDLSEGDKVCFTDMNGTVFEYKVTKIRHTVSATPDKLSSKAAHLVLFTKLRQSSKYAVAELVMV